jgi:hypothetical protein
MPPKSSHLTFPCYIFDWVVLFYWCKQSWGRSTKFPNTHRLFPKQEVTIPYRFVTLLTDIFGTSFVRGTPLTVSQADPIESSGWQDSWEFGQYVVELQGVGGLWVALSPTCKVINWKSATCSIYIKRYPLGQRPCRVERLKKRKYLQPSVIPKMVHDRHWQDFESGSQDLGGGRRKMD